MRMILKFFQRIFIKCLKMLTISGKMETVES